MQENAQRDPLLYDLRRSSAFIGLTVWQLRGIIARQEIAIVTVGRKIYIRKTTLERWAERNEGKA